MKKPKKRDEFAQDIKSENVEDIDDKPKDGFDVAKDMYKMHDSELKILTADNVLAYFKEEKDKTFIAEFVDCIIAINQNVKDMKATWIENCKKNPCMDPPSKEDIERFNEIRLNLRETFLGTINGLCLLNRNRPDNPIVNKGMQVADTTTSDNPELEEDDGKLKSTLKKLIANKEKNAEQNSI